MGPRAISKFWPTATHPLKFLQDKPSLFQKPTGGKKDIDDLEDAIISRSLCQGTHIDPEKSTVYRSSIDYLHDTRSSHENSNVMQYSTWEHPPFTDPFPVLSIFHQHLVILLPLSRLFTQSICSLRQLQGQSAVLLYTWVPCCRNRKPIDLVKPQKDGSCWGYDF